MCMSVCLHLHLRQVTLHYVRSKSHKYYIRECLLSCKLLLNCLGDWHHVYHLLCALQYTTACLWLH